jgi:hypothetical protein
LIAGTSENNDGTKELILIKTDSKGNQEWIYGAAQDLATLDSEAKSVIEIPSGGYVVGGTVDNGNTRRSILLSFSSSGGLTNSVLIKTDEGIDPKANEVSKITLGTSGILVCGQTEHTASGKGGKNGYVRLFNETTLDSIQVGAFYVQYIGSAGDDEITGAYEVSETSHIGVQGSQFLVFGTTDNERPGEKDFFYMGLTAGFVRNPDIGETTIVNKTGNKQTANYITQYKDAYWMIGESDLNVKQIMLVGWEFRPNEDNDWNITTGSFNEITSDESIAGKGIAVQSDGKFVLASDVIYTIDEHSEIHLARVGLNDRKIKSPWPKIYGTTTSTYTAAAVTILSDGSIVTVGTADLEPIKKIIVIKTGPDGQMSF